MAKDPYTGRFIKAADVHPDPVLHRAQGMPVAPEPVPDDAPSDLPDALTGFDKAKVVLVAVLCAAIILAAFGVATWLAS